MKSVWKWLWERYSWIFVDERKDRVDKALAALQEELQRNEPLFTQSERERILGRR